MQNKSVSILLHTVATQDQPFSYFTANRKTLETQYFLYVFNKLTVPLLYGWLFRLLSQLQKPKIDPLDVGYY